MSPLDTPNLLLLCSLIIFSIHPPYSFQASFLTPISKDKHTRQYTTTLLLRTPPQPTKLIVDLGASFSWVDCQNNYTSSTYHHTPCNSTLCHDLNSLACANCYTPPAPDCGNFTCALFPENSVTGNASVDDAMIDTLAMSTTDGSNPGQVRVVPDFVFSCSKSYLLEGLAQGVVGLLGLGRANYSFPRQISRDFSRPNVFALCLPGSARPNVTGVGFYGSIGPYNFLPGIDLSESLIYTPLVVNPCTDTIITYANQNSDQYFIGVTAVKIDGKEVPLNKTLLAVDQTSGIGGTKISTVHPYTRMDSSILKAFAEAFDNAASTMNLTRVNAVKPFSLCYSVDGITSTRVGPAVPTVDLVLQSDDVVWRIFGANSMVRISRKHLDAWCLGFVDGGAISYEFDHKQAIQIGGLQLEDNLLQFDLENNRLGFSSSVLLRQTTCANFNFTTSNSIS